MNSQLKKLRSLRGKKIIDIEFRWNDLFEDYFIDALVFEDGTRLELWGKADLVSWVIDYEPIAA
jgi:hypothetical protein